MMKQTLQFQYKGQLIELVNVTENNECLAFENDSWRMEITHRDEISFQIRIKYQNPTILQDSFYYHCYCLIDKSSVFLLNVYDLLADENADAQVVTSFVKPMTDSVVKQLRKELLHPFSDPDYLEKYIREWEKNVL